MAGGQLTSVLAHLWRIGASERRGLAPPDDQLLRRFLERRDADAFAQLVERHGPLVWNVCVRVLQHAHDAEDAFQATFLILARKARSIQKQPSLASWLYGVAYRTATRARNRRQAERERVMKYAANPTPNPLPDWATAGRGQGERSSDWQDLRPILDEEVNQLPEKYRTPVVLCYFEGQTNDEAARTLGWPKGTVAGRLARARDLLRRRLLRRGLAFSSAGLGSLIAANAASAAMPGAFLSTIPPAALAFAAGKAVAASSATAIAEGVMHAMFITKLRIAAVVCLGAILLTLGGGTAVYRALGGEHAALTWNLSGVGPATGANFDEKPKSDEELIQGTWKCEKRDEATGKVLDEETCVFKGERFWIINRQGKQEGPYRFRLNASKSPKEFDVPAPSGDTLEGIYEVDSKTLRLALPFDPDNVKFMDVIVAKDKSRASFRRPKNFADPHAQYTRTFQRQQLADKPKPDAELLLGTWVRVSGGDDPALKDKPVRTFDKVIFTRDLFQFCFDDTKHDYKWSIDATKSPKELDIIEKEQTPGKAKQKPVPCIYKLDGDRLEIAMGDPGLRPNDFAKAGKFGQHFILKRENAASEKPKDEELLQGTWTSPEQTLIFKGDQYTLTRNGVEFGPYRYRLDASKSPREIDDVDLDANGPPYVFHPRDALYSSIYEVSPDTLKIGQTQDRQSRPKDWNSAVVFAYQRQKAAEKPKTDEELIQGTWKWQQVSEATGKVLAEITLVFKGDRYWILERDHELGPYRFRLDATKTPKHLDAEEPEGRTALRIYELDGDILKLGGVPPRKAPEPGVVDAPPAERPKSFAEASVITYHRVGKTSSSVLPLKHTDATRVAEIMQNLFKGSDAAKIVADSRTNSLVLSGTAKQLEEIKQVLDKIDALAAKPDKEKPSDPAQPGALTPRARDIVKEMIETAKAELQVRNQEYMESRRLDADSLSDASRRLAAAYGHDPAGRKEYLSALEAHVQRMKDAENIAKKRFDSGRITGSEMPAIKYARLEAELWLEREKAKPKGQEQGRIEIQRMKVEMAEAVLAAKKDRVPWAETMVKKGFLAESGLAAAKADVKAAEIAVAEAKLELEKLLADEKPRVEQK